MTQKTTQVNVSGLATQPNPYSQVAPGSLAVADNCVMRKAGALQALPDNTASTTLLATQIPVRSFDGGPGFIGCVTKQSAAADGDTLVLTEVDGTYTAISSVALGSSSRSLVFKPGETQGAVARGRLVVTESNAPIVATYETDGTILGARVAGLPPPGNMRPLNTGVVTADQVWNLSPGNFFAYKAIFKRVSLDPAYELKSAPTATYIVENTGANNAYIQMYVEWQPSVDPVVIGDYVVIYRTTQAGTVDELGDYFQEVMSYQLTNVDIANGFISVFDKVNDLALGSLLYTNAEQEQATGGNLMPPPSVDVCTYNDTTFYVSKSSWPIVSLHVSGPFGTLPNILGEWREIGIGNRAVNGTSAVGSPNITGVVAADRRGLNIGQLLDSALGGGANFPAGSTIASITGAGPYTVTMSANATIAGAASFTFYDTVKFTAWKNGVSSQETIPITGSVQDLGRRVTAMTVVKGMRLVRSGAGDTSSTSLVLPYGVDFGFWSPISGLWDSFTVTLTNGTNYSPIGFIGVGGFNSVDSIQDTRPNRIYFSKTTEPEHVAPVNYFDVGAEKILKLWATQSAMFAFCTDGLWRITGTSAPFQVQQLDKTLNLVHPDGVCALDNEIYAWVTDGLAVVGDSGAATISTEAVGPALKEQLETYRALVGGGYAFWGPSVACDNFRKEVWLNFDFSSNTVPSHIFYKSYIFNRETKAFTTQTASQFRTLVYAQHLNALVSSIGNVLYLPSTSAWKDMTVQFNPLSADDLGVLKQWIDTNLFVADLTGPGSIAVSFDGTPVTTRAVTTVTAQGLHTWVPRRTALNKQLKFGFSTSGGINLTLYGFTARFRISSETLKR